MTSVLEMALEALKYHREQTRAIALSDTAIFALEEAIKNQGEPVGWQQATHANAPKYGERVIVLTTDADGDPIPEFAHYNGELGFLGIGGKRIKPVSYWMPSPTAPKGEQP